VAQPTLSVAIRKLEGELGVALFERKANEVRPTETGARIVAQAQRALDEANRIKEIARQGKDPLAGPLRVGVIYTIGPYLLPPLVRQLLRDAPRMPLLLNENFTLRLLELLKTGEIDVAIMAEPLPESGGLMAQPVYDETFAIAVPREHAWTARKHVAAEDLKKETMLLLGMGHCFRDQVLEVCPELSRLSTGAEGFQRTFEGSSLETIRHMVASGLGITVLPMSSVPEQPHPDSLLAYVPFKPPVPNRRVVLAWRKSFTREAAIEMLRAAIGKCPLHGATMLDSPRAPT
jgi:LysR family hydrogen peroxide-inducible transcriptional activator